MLLFVPTGLEMLIAVHHSHQQITLFGYCGLVDGTHWQSGYI
jgi:hypothetical protein